MSIIHNNIPPSRVHVPGFMQATDPFLIADNRIQPASQWIDTSGVKPLLKIRNSGNTSWDIISGVEIFEDGNFRLVNSTDDSKQVAFDCSNISPSTTRTLTIPDADTTLVGVDTTQDITNKTLIDDSTIIANVSDTSRKAKFSTSGISASTTRTIHLPNANTSLVGDTTLQTLTNKKLDDSTTLFQNTADNTRKLKFDVGGVGGATTRTLSVQDVNGTIYVSGGADVPILDGGTGASIKSIAFNNLSPLATKGDLIVYNGSDNVNFGCGLDGQILSTDTSQAANLRWVTVSGATDEKVMASDTDTVAGKLTGANAKLQAGTNVTFTLINPGANEKIQISATGGGGGGGGTIYTQSVAGSVDVGDSSAIASPVMLSGRVDLPATATTEIELWKTLGVEVANIYSIQITTLGNNGSIVYLTNESANIFPRVAGSGNNIIKINNNSSDIVSVYLFVVVD